MMVVELRHGPNLAKRPLQRRHLPLGRNPCRSVRDLLGHAARMSRHRNLRAPTAASRAEQPNRNRNNNNNNNPKTGSPNNNSKDGGRRPQPAPKGDAARPLPALRHAPAVPEPDRARDVRGRQLRVRAPACGRPAPRPPPDGLLRGRLRVRRRVQPPRCREACWRCSVRDQEGPSTTLHRPTRVRVLRLLCGSVQNDAPEDCSETQTQAATTR